MEFPFTKINHNYNYNIRNPNKLFSQTYFSNLSNIKNMNSTNCAASSTLTTSTLNNYNDYNDMKNLFSKLSLKRSLNDDNDADDNYYLQQVKSSKKQRVKYQIDDFPLLSEEAVEKLSEFVIDYENYYEDNNNDNCNIFSEEVKQELFINKSISSDEIFDEIVKNFSNDFE